MSKTEEPYPYNLPFFRRSHSATSPDGKQSAAIERADEMGMSNPTMGQLRLNDDLKIDHCSPSFVWSDDSRYLAVPQWMFRWFRPRRERLIIIDTQEEQLYFSRPNFINLIIKSFNGGILQVVNTPTRRPTEISISLSDATKSFKKAAYENQKEKYR